MKFAIANWIAPLVVVAIAPAEFDSPQVDELMAKLESHFRGANFTVITPAPEASSGIRSRGLACPHDVLTDSNLVWRDLVLPEDPDLPF